MPTPCPPGLVRCRTAGEYDGLLRALLLAHKEHQVFGLARELGRLLALAVVETVVLHPGQPTALVPVPTRRSMIRARGHDPTARIVRSAAGVLRSCGHDVRVLPLLRHRLPVEDQAGLDAAARASNRGDTLGLAPAQRAALERVGTLPVVVVCDDVLTTGSTAREAQRALTDAGVPVAAFAAVAATRRRSAG